MEECQEVENIKINKLLLNIFKNIASVEVKSNICRNILTNSNNFDPNFVFTHISKGNNNIYISINDIIFYLENNNIFCDKESVKFLVSIYDFNKDGSWDIHEFINFLGLKNIKEKEKMSNNPINFYKTNDLPSNIGYYLTKLFLSELDFCKKQLNFLKYLTEDVFDLFSRITEGDTINFKDLETFILSNFPDNSFKQSEINNIFSRMDLNKSDNISYEKFRTFLKHRNYSQITSLENEEYYSSKVRTNILNKNSPIRKSGGLNNSNFLSKSNQSTFLESAEYQKNNISFFSKSFKTVSQSPNRSYVNVCSKTKKCDLEHEMFINFLKFISSFEKEIENLKINLIKQNEFNLTDLYSLFKRTGEENQDELNNSILLYQKNFLSRSEFVQGLNQLEIYPTENDIKLFLNRHNEENYQQIEITKFFEIFYPHDIYNKNHLKAKKPIRKELSKELLNSIKEFMSALFEEEAKIEAWRLKLSRMNKFNLTIMFEKCCVGKMEFITFNTLKEFLNDFILDELDLQLLYNRFDKAKINRVTYSDFTNEVFPQTK
jgi:Ca2+-binding EF-hand superfamily protein